MRNGSFDILAKIDAAVSDLGTFEWLYSRLHSKRASGPTEVQTPEEVWKRNTLYVVLHKILSSLRDRFENNRALYERLSVFHPSNFSMLVKTGKIVCDLIPTVTPFYERFHLDFIKCAQERCVFREYAANCFAHPQLLYRNMKVMRSKLKKMKMLKKLKKRTNQVRAAIMHRLSQQRYTFLCNETYHLKDAFPELCKVYGIICTIPISSCTAERSF